MRLPDWQSRLAAVMREAQARPFAWGSHDCATFAATCVVAVTGVDRIADVRAAWQSELQAARLLERLGGLRAAIGERLGAPLASVALAQPGDVGISDQAGRDALCVCGGVNWHMPAELGLATLAADQVLCAWRCEWA